MTIESIDLTEYARRQSLYLNEERVSDSYALYGGVDEQTLIRGTSRKTRAEIAGSVHAWLLGKMGFTVGGDLSRSREEAAKREISARPVVMASLLEATQRAADKVLELQPGSPAPSQEEREPFDFIRCVSPQAVITRPREGVYNLGIPPDESPLPRRFPPLFFKASSTHDLLFAQLHRHYELPRMEILGSSRDQAVIRARV